MLDGFINDADYATTSNGVHCPAYIAWRRVIQECRGLAPNCGKPVTVSDEWKRFSNFRKWWIESYVAGYRMNTITARGNKIYCEDSCVFIPSWIEQSFFRAKDKRSGASLNVGAHKRGVDRFASQLGKTRYSKARHLGTFDTTKEASNAYCDAKIEYAKECKPEMDAIDVRIYPSAIKRIEEQRHD